MEGQFLQSQHFPATKMMQIQRLFLVCLVFQVAYARTVRFVRPAIDRIF